MQDKIFVLVGMSGLIISIIAEIGDFVPDLGIEILDYAILGIMIYVLDIPSLALGDRIPKRCSILLVVISFVILIMFRNSVPVHFVIVIAIGLVIANMFQITKTLNWNNLNNTLRKKYDISCKNVLKEDPQQFTKNIKMLWGLVIVDSIFLVRFGDVVARNMIGGYCAVIALPFLYNAFDQQIPLSAIFSVLILIISVTKVGKKNMRGLTKKIGLIKETWLYKDKVEDVMIYSMTKKIFTRYGLLYFLVITGVLLPTIATIGGIGPIIMNIPNAYSQKPQEFTPLNVAFVIFGTIGVGVPLLVPLYYGTKIILSSRKQRTVLQYHYFWLIYSIFIFMVTTRNQDLFTKANLYYDGITSIIFGTVTFVMIAHMLIAHKFNKKIILTRNLENLIVGLLIPYSIYLFSYNSNIFDGIASVVLPSWLWYSAITVFEKSITKMNRVQKRASTSLFFCFIAIGIYLIVVMAEIPMAIAVFIGSFLLPLWFVEKTRRQWIAKNIFGISEVSK